MLSVVTTRVPVVLSTFLLAGLMSACSAPANESACDAAAVTDEIEHMVGEAQQEVGSVDELTCSGDWAVVVATVGGAGASLAPQTFVLRRGDVGWVLKSPEIACEAGTDPIPDDLAAIVCPAS